MQLAPRLTQYSHGAGCGCKIAPKVLDTILAASGQQLTDPRLWVGNNSKDDAAVFEINAEQGKLAFAEHLLTSLNRITKRLGNERYQQLEQLMQAALNKNCLAIHREWISLLLESYYDPMYRYQRQKKSSQIIFSGTAEAVAEFLQQQPTHH